MHSDVSWAPMKSQSSARLRSIGFGLQALVLRFSSTVTFFAPSPLTVILRASQLSTASRPLFVSWSRAIGALLPLARTLAFFVRFLASCWSKVVEVALILTLPFFRPLTLTWIPSRLSACFWLVATFSVAFFALAWTATAMGTNTATATTSADSLEILLTLTPLVASLPGRDDTSGGCDTTGA